MFIANYYGGSLARSPGGLPSETSKVVKVALIDDGVDVDEVLIPCIGSGASYDKAQGSDKDSRSFYVSSLGHGTIMANCIRRVCPNIKLYVAKLDDHPTERGARQFTASSAAEVGSPLFYTMADC